MVRLVLACALLFLPLAAQAEELTGSLREVDERLTLVRPDGSELALKGDLAETLRPFAGLPVRLDGQPRNGGLSRARILSPVRGDHEVEVHAKDGGFLLRGEDGEQWSAVGNTAVLEAGRKTVVDLWRFDHGVAFVLAAQAQTVDEWTLLHKEVLGYEVPGGFVRGLGRSVWVTARRTDGSLFVRRGDDDGWVRPGKLVFGEAITSRAGMTDRLR